MVYNDMGAAKQLEFVSHIVRACHTRVFLVRSAHGSGWEDLGFGLLVSRSGFRGFAASPDEQLGLALLVFDSGARSRRGPKMFRKPECERPPALEVVCSRGP